MGYYTIGKQKIFVHRNLDQALREEALSDWSPLDRIGSLMVGPQSVKADQLIFKVLEEKARRPDFYDSFVRFSLQGDDAQLNAWDLLYDFCHLRGCGRLIDSRDFVEKLEADYAGELHLYPQGKVFDLDFSVQARRPVLREWILKRERTRIRIRIDVRKIEKIHGELEAFEIAFGDHRIAFDKDGIHVGA